MNVQTATTSENPVKRRAILDSAIRTFAELGFRGTDVQVIADRAGVGKGTVYRYFGNKQDLFWATMLEVFLRLQDHLLAATEGVAEPLEQLRAACLAYAGFFDADAQYLEVFVQDRAEFRGAAPDSHREYHEKLIDHFAGLIERGIAIGRFRPVDARKTVISLGGVLYGCVVHSCYMDHNYSLTEVTRHAVDVFLQGLRHHGEPSEGDSPCGGDTRSSG